MKKILVYLLLFVSINIVNANPNSYDVIYDEYQAVYSPSEKAWSAGGMADDKIVLTKKLYEGEGEYSKYYHSNGNLAFTLTTGCEIIIDGKLILVDNNLLKFSQMIYDNGDFIEVSLNEEEIRNLFPDADLIKISTIDDDNKTWLYKPFFKKKKVLLYNDTDKFFHKITCKTKGVQDENIKALVTFSRFGAYRFEHFGEYKGKLIFYIR